MRALSMRHKHGLMRRSSHRNGKVRHSTPQQPCPPVPRLHLLKQGGLLSQISPGHNMRNSSNSSKQSKQSRGGLAMKALSMRHKHGLMRRSSHRNGKVRHNAPQQPCPPVPRLHLLKPGRLLSQISPGHNMHNSSKQSKQSRGGLAMRALSMRHEHSLMRRSSHRNGKVRHNTPQQPCPPVPRLHLLKQGRLLSQISPGHNMRNSSKQSKQSKQSRGGLAMKALSMHHEHSLMRRSSHRNARLHLLKQGRRLSQISPGHNMRNSSKQSKQSRGGRAMKALSMHHETQSDAPQQPSQCPCAPAQARAAAESDITRAQHAQQQQAKQAEPRRPSNESPEHASRTQSDAPQQPSQWQSAPQYPPAALPTGAPFAPAQAREAAESDARAKRKQTLASEVERILKLKARGHSQNWQLVLQLQPGFRSAELDAKKRFPLVDPAPRTRRGQ